MLLLGHVLAVEVWEGRMKDEKAVFVLRSRIGSFRGLGRPLRGQVHPLVAAKRTSAEIMALKPNISNHTAVTAHAYNDGRAYIRRSG